MENASKLNTLLVEGGYKALKRVFNIFHPPGSLRDHLIANKSTLKKLLDGNILKKYQWDKLFPPSEEAPDASTFDVTLLFILLETICGLSPPSPDECSKPPQTFTSLVESIYNLRRLHDEQYASKDRFDTPTFNELWDSICSVLVNLGLEKNEIDHLIRPFEEENKEPPLSSGWLNSGEMEKSISQRVKALEEALKCIQERDNHNAKDYLPTAG